MLWSLLLACVADEPRPSCGPLPAMEITLSLANGGVPSDCMVGLFDEPGEDGLERKKTQAPCNNGVVCFDSVAPGPYVLVVEGKHTARKELPVTVTAETHHALGPFDLDPGGDISATIFTPEGAPASHTRVRLEPGDFESRTDTAGHVHFRGAPAGWVELFALSGLYGGTATVEVLEGIDTPVAIDLARLPSRPVLGLRFVTNAAGAEVTWVHPSGPAAGRLSAGDVLIRADEHSLVGLDPEEAGPLLVGEIGETRTITLLRNGQQLSHQIAAVPMDTLAE